LHAHSCYSLLDGVPFPEELAERAAELGLPAIALTSFGAVAEPYDCHHTRNHQGGEQK